MPSGKEEMGFELSFGTLREWKKFLKSPMERPEINEVREIEWTLI